MANLLYQAFQTHPMFEGISLSDCKVLMNCLGCVERSYKKDQVISVCNHSTRLIGIVVDGCVHTVKEDIWGRPIFLAYTGSDGIIGDTMVSEDLASRGVVYKAAEPATILFLPADRILHPCRNSCPFHHLLSRNLFNMVSNRNVALMEKIEITSKSSLREKILAYLSLEAQKNRSTTVTVPLNRAEMADYLCTNRSALSRELANMKKDGILDYDRRVFHLHSGEQV